MNLKCRNRSCGKFSEVDGNTVYCKNCGKSYSEFGLDIPRLVKMNNDRRDYFHKYFIKYYLIFSGLLVGLFMVILFRVTDIDSVVQNFPWSILLFMVILCFILWEASSRANKKADIKYPELANLDQE